jgi:hypothetical protein
MFDRYLTGKRNDAKMLVALLGILRYSFSQQTSVSIQADEVLFIQQIIK